MLRCRENMFKANILLHKLDHPAVCDYLEEYMPFFWKYFSCKYVQICRYCEKEAIKEQLKGKSVIVMADETSNKRGRSVFAVSLKTIDSDIL